jgi:hypothetical protein
MIMLPKIAFIACGPEGTLRSPRGHTAAAAVVIGGLAAVLADDRHLAVPVSPLAGC